MGAQERDISYLDEVVEVGVRYLKGDGLEQSYQNAFEILAVAAIEGHPEAQYIIGVVYDEGRGVRQSYKKAFKWYKLAAEQGNGRAQYRLAQMYKRGEGVKVSRFRAMRWFRKAALNKYERIPLGSLFDPESTI